MYRIKLFIITGLLIVASTSAYALWGNSEQGKTPYDCGELRLKSASNTDVPGKRSYIFSGICTVQMGSQSKKLWLKVSAKWNPKDNMATEDAQIVGGDTGKMRLVMRCDDDPWMGHAPCVLDKKMSSASFDQFLQSFKGRKSALKGDGLSHPPLARGVMTASQINSVLAMPLAKPMPVAVALKKVTDPLLVAKNKAVGAAKSVTETVQKKVTGPALRAVRANKKLFSKPLYKGHRIHLCLRWHGECGVPAADAFCKSKGFKRALDWVEDHNAGKSVVVGDNRLCSRDTCDVFASITCVR